MNVRACILGCRNADGIPFRAAPGWLACHRCSDRLRQTLADIFDTYATLTDIDELIPGGHGDTSGGRKPPGPRSPAVDALLVYTDPRSVLDDQPAALATIESWARMIREERSLDVPPDQMLATVPAGRVTMTREMQTIRFNWDWLMAQPWLDEFAAEMRDVLAALRRAGRELPPVLSIGPCPALVPIEVGEYGALRDTPCGVTLRVKVDAEEIRCRACGAIWPRSQWWRLGDPWADYAELSEQLKVPAATLRGWCREDRWHTWRKTPNSKRVLVDRYDALASFGRRRGKVVA